MAGKILRFPLTLLLLGGVVFLALYTLAQIVASSVPAIRNTPVQALVALLFAVIGIGAYKLFERRVERRTAEEYAGQGAGRELASGLLFGCVLFSATAGVVALMGGLTLTGEGGIGALWLMAAMAISSGIYEELIFRGIFFRHLEAMLGSWAALILTSAFFGAAHLANPGATPFAALAIALEAGLLLGAAYMFTRRLWLASGIHAGWNFTQGWVFSAPVSGGKSATGLLLTSRPGPDWLTGGAFGLEASVVAMAVAGLAGMVMLRAAYRRDRFIASPLGRRSPKPKPTPAGPSKGD